MVLYTLKSTIPSHIQIHAEITARVIPQKLCKGVSPTTPTKDIFPLLKAKKKKKRSKSLCQYMDPIAYFITIKQIHCTLGNFVMPSFIKLVIKTKRQPWIFMNSSQAGGIAIIYSKPGLAQITSLYDWSLSQKSLWVSVFAVRISPSMYSHAHISLGRLLCLQVGQGTAEPLKSPWSLEHLSRCRTRPVLRSSWPQEDFSP